MRRPPRTPRTARRTRSGIMRNLLFRRRFHFGEQTFRQPNSRPLERPVPSWCDTGTFIAARAGSNLCARRPSIRGTGNGRSRQLLTLIRFSVFDFQGLVARFQLANPGSAFKRNLRLPFERRTVLAGRALRCRSVRADIGRDLSWRRGQPPGAAWRTLPGSNPSLARMST